MVMAKIKPKQLATFVKAASAPPFVKSKIKLAPIDVDEIRQQLEDGEGDEEIMALVDDYDPEKDGNPPSWIDPADESTWERAKEAAGPEGESEAEDYWAVVTHVFKKMGGTVKARE
jgi:hypothetical protein